MSNEIRCLEVRGGVVNYKSWKEANIANRAHLVTRLEFQKWDTINVDKDFEQIESAFRNLVIIADVLNCFEGHVDEIEKALPKAGFDKKTADKIRKDIATVRAKGESWLRYHCF